MLKLGGDGYILPIIDGEAFIAYSKVIGVRVRGEIILSELWHCSRTVCRWRCKWLGESGVVTRTRVKNGEYKVVGEIKLQYGYKIGETCVK